MNKHPPKEAFTAVIARIFGEPRGARVERVTPLTGGVSADVYRLDVQFEDKRTTTVVVRAHGASHSGHPAKLEFELLDSLHKRALPVPKPLLLDTSCTTLPHPFLVIEFIAGNTAIPPGDKDHYIERMARQLADIHDTPTLNLPSLPQRTNPLPEVLDFLPEGDEWAPLRQHLRSLDDTGYELAPRLLHGDFWPENLLWQNQAIAAVLDWEDAALGDPLSDVAACRVELRYLLGASAMTRFTQAYAQYRSVDAERLALWQVYVAAAAQKYMGQWSLAADREAHMRNEALKSIREAASILKPALFN